MAPHARFHPWIGQLRSSSIVRAVLVLSKVTCGRQIRVRSLRTLSHRLDSSANEKPRLRKCVSLPPDRTIGTGPELHVRGRSIAFERSRESRLNVLTAAISPRTVLMTSFCAYH